MGSSKVNCLAFVDDLVLRAQTPDILTDLLNPTSALLDECGLSINTAKSLTISLKGLGKEKKCIVEHRTFKLKNRKLPFLNRSDSWRNLGIRFSLEGGIEIHPYQELHLKIDRLTKAPLKPLQ